MMPRNSSTGVAVDNAEIERWLEELRVEHRDLDEVIGHLIESRHPDNMRIQRLKKAQAQAEGHDHTPRKRTDPGSRCLIQHPPCH